MVALALSVGLYGVCGTVNPGIFSIGVSQVYPQSLVEVE